MDKLPKLLIRTSSGRHCRVEFEASADSLAAKTTWSGDCTAEDIAEVEAVLNDMMRPHLAPGAEITSVDLGYASQAERDEVVKRFLKANEN